MAKETSKGPEVMLLRFRRTTMIKGVTYPANANAAVPNCDEAWDAVNAGQADLDPPPGTPGQVGVEHIPERLTSAPAPPSALAGAPAAAPTKPAK